MKNLDLNLRGDVLTIKIRLDEEHGDSQSGRSTIIASTEGNIPVFRGKQDLGLYLNCNLYRRKPKNDPSNPFHRRSRL